MSVTDPLAEHRLGPAETLKDLESYLVPRDGERLSTWAKGGPPILLTERAILFVQGGEAYRVSQGQVTAFGLTRSSDVSYKRWGLGLYLGSLVFLFLHWPLAVLMAIAGGVLVTMGFLSKAILVQTDDDRLPPFILDHRKWRSLRKALRRWRSEQAGKASR